MPEAPMIDFWLSMGSTYTYLTVMRLGAVEDSASVRFRLRPFNLRAIFDDMSYFPFPAELPKTAYMWRDVERRAASYGIPIRVPAPYPAKNSALTNRVALVGSQEGWVKEFALTAYRRWFQFGEEFGRRRSYRVELARYWARPTPCPRSGPRRAHSATLGFRNRPCTGTWRLRFADICC